MSKPRVSESLFARPLSAVLGAALAMSMGAMLAMACVTGDDTVGSCMVGVNGAVCSKDTDCLNAGGNCNPTTCLCEADSPTTGPGATSTTGAEETTAGPMTAGQTTGETTTGTPPGDSTSSGGGTTSGGSGVGVCAPSCTVDDDCSTPTEESCIGGLCFNDCLVKGCSGALFTCVTVVEIPDCVVQCIDDTDCIDGDLCAGLADDGTTFCVTLGYNGCSRDLDCDGSSQGAVCLSSGTCGCMSEADCNGDGCGHA